MMTPGKGIQRPQDQRLLLSAARPSFVPDISVTSGSLRVFRPTVSCTYFSTASFRQLHAVAVLQVLVAQPT